MKKLKRTLATIGASLLMILGLAIGVPTSASAASGTITGNALCGYGNNQVVGIWVDAFSGNDGYAAMGAPQGNLSRNYSYTLSQSTNYRLHVGCSGTPSNWGGTFTSPDLSAQYYDLSCTVSGGRQRCALS